MHIYINGELVQTTSVNLHDLVSELSLSDKRFAIELNQKIIPKSQLATQSIQSHDHIEIIHAVGGG